MLCFALFTTPTFAESEYSPSSSEYQINSLTDLKAELDYICKDSTITPESPEIENLLKITNPTIVQEFLEEKFDTLGDILANPNSFSSSRTIDLGDNCYVRMSSTPTAPEEENPYITPFQSTPGANTYWKDYGDRKFTSTFEGNLVLGAFKLNMCNHYTCDSKGVLVRYVEAWGNGGGLIQISCGSVNGASKGDRAKVGQTVSANCIFTASGSGLIQKSFKMYNKVKCSEIDTVEKKVKVVQSWNGEYL